MPSGRALRRAMVTAIALTFACAPIAGISVKRCRPGCVDAETRLVCDGETARAVKCPAATEPCAAPSCSEGACGYRPRIGAFCGPDGIATCNEGYACIGPRTELSAIRLHTCALADDGKVWCWGDNPYGELGDGTTTNSGFPLPVRLPRPAIDVSAGYSHTCAVLDDGAVYCWGNNVNRKAVPTSYDFNVSEPTRVEAPNTSFTRVSCAEDHTCAITERSTVWCWGSTREGQCGVDGSVAGVDWAPPTEVPHLDEVRSIDSGLAHTCAVRRGTPSLVCWGSNRSRNDGGYVDGKLGPAAGSLAYSASPVPTDFGVPVLDVGIGYESTYAVVADGVTYAWGSNVHGQLGITEAGSMVNTPRPVVMYDDKQRLKPLGSVSEVLRADATDQCVKMQDLSRNSRYLCWGTDEFGELGLGIAGETAPFPTATTVLPESVANLARGEQHGCFTAEEDGVVRIYCFGRAALVADGTTDQVADQLSPAAVQWDPKRFERLLAQ